MNNERMNTNKKMNDLEIGDRVKVVSVPDSLETENSKIKIGMTGTVKNLVKHNIGIEFDDYVGGHNGGLAGKQGHCWYIEYYHLEKIEETDAEAKETKEEVEEMDIAEETKTNTLEEKVLEVLRKEIGVEIGEEFDVYKKGNMLWRCKFERNRFFCKGHYELQKSEVWKNIIANFHEYTFKRKSFIPEYEKDYFFLSKNYDENKNIKFSVLHNIWVDNIIDYGMLALGNVFRSEEEASKNKDKLLEKMKKLRKGE